MRLLTSALPARSHIDNVMEFARASVGMGHRVTALLPEGEVAPVGVELTPSKIREIGSMASGAGDAWLTRQIENWNRFMRSAYADRLAAIDRLTPDLVIRDFSDRAMLLACETAGVPHIAVGCTTDSPVVRRVEPHYWINDFRRELGRPAYDNTAQQIDRGFLTRRPRVLYEHSESLVPHASFVRYHAPSADAESVGRTLEAIAGEPYAVVSFGTMRREEVRRLADRAMSACHAVGLTPVIIEGDGRFKVSRDRAAVRVTSLPLSGLLPDARVLITHAGINSALEASVAETAACYLPLSGDNFSTAARMTRLRQGVTVDAAADDSSLASAIAGLLSNTISDVVKRENLRAVTPADALEPLLTGALDHEL